MKFELRVNGRMEIRLQPETPVERAVLDAMETEAAKGATTSLKRVPGPTTQDVVGVGYVIWVDK